MKSHTAGRELAAMGRAEMIAAPVAATAAWRDRSQRRSMSSNAVKAVSTSSMRPHDSTWRERARSPRLHEPAQIGEGVIAWASTLLHGADGATGSMTPAVPIRSPNGDQDGAAITPAPMARPARGQYTWLASRPISPSTKAAGT